MIAAAFTYMVMYPIKPFWLMAGLGVALFLAIVAAAVIGFWVYRSSNKQE